MQQNLRMVAASFLVEYMGADWRHGFRWFHDTLVDADLAINSMMWQNAGRSGIDQWNFVLNPTEGKSRDPNCAYVKRWVPEVRGLSKKDAFEPYIANPVVAPGGGLKVAQQRHVADVLAMRRAHPHVNDGGGYDVIQLPDGSKTRVFTKKPFRI